MYDDKPDDQNVYLEGKNAVVEAMRSGRAPDKLFLERGNGSLGHIAAMAKKLGAPVADVDRRKLDRMSRTGAHQGVIAVMTDYGYCEPADILARACELGQKPLIVVCDQIEDPHNLGAVIRNAEAAGAHGVIIPKRHSPGMTAAVARASAGALSHTLVARVPNIPGAIKELKEAGVWVFGSDPSSVTPMYKGDLAGPCAIVIGSEGKGMGRLVSELCDFTVAIPMMGKISSLNASSAAAVLLFEAVRQRAGGNTEGRNE